MTLEEYISFGEKAYDLFKDCIIILSLKQQIHYINRSGCRLLKYNAEELYLKNIKSISRELSEVMHVAPAYQHNLTPLQTITQRKITFTDNKGEIFKTSASLLPLPNKDAFVGFKIVFNDPNTKNGSPNFSQRGSLINALNLRSDEFCYIQNIADGRNEFVSKSSEKFVGWKVEDLMSAAFAISKQHPDEMWMIEDFYKKRERWFKHPGKYDHIAVHYKYRMMHKNGYYVHLKITIMLLERDERNVPKYTICFGKSYQPKKEVALSNNSTLTIRETEVLQMLANGNSYKMTASQLSISIDSVRTYVRRMYEKLQVHSVTEAIHKTLH